MPASNDRASSSQTAAGSLSEPLGLKHPLLPASALGQRVLMPQFTAPLGARSLMPSLPAVPEYAPAVSFDDSPFFAVSRSSLSMQPKRSPVAPVLMDASSVIQPIREEGISKRRLSERSTLQRFSEPIPFQASPITGHEAPPMPTAAISPDPISNGTTEATNSPGISPLTEMGMDYSRRDHLESDGVRSQPFPAAIAPSSIVHSPTQQGLAAFGTDQPTERGGGDIVLPPSIQRSSEVAALTPEHVSESTSPLGADSIANLSSYTAIPSEADRSETAPPPTPVIQPKLETAPAAVAPVSPPRETSQLDASPQVTLRSAPEIASPEVANPEIASLEIASSEIERNALPQPAHTPLLTPLSVSSLAPPEASPPNIQPRLDASSSPLHPDQPQSIQDSANHETALFSAIPVQETPSTSPLQRQADSLPTGNLDRAALPAITTAPLSDNTSSPIQTRLEATAKNLPSAQMIPKAVNLTESATEPFPSEQSSDAPVDFIPVTEQLKDVVPEAQASPDVQRSPTETAANQQAHALTAIDLPSNAIQLQAELTEETATSTNLSPAPEATIALPETVSSVSPHSTPPIVKPSVEPTVEASQLGRSAIPSSTVSPRSNNAGDAALQRKHAELNQPPFQTQLQPESVRTEPVQSSMPSPIADIAVPFTREDATPTFSNSPDETHSAPLTPIGRDADVMAQSTLQAFTSPSPIASQDTLVAASSSPPQPSIQRQTALDVAALPASLSEPKRDDRPLNATYIQREDAITHGNTAIHPENPFALANSDAIGVVSQPAENSSTPEATPTNSTVVQTHPEQKAFPLLPTALQNLTTLNPLGNANPLAQPSLLTAPPADLQRKAVQLMADASPNMALKQAESRVHVPPVTPQMGNQVSPFASTPSSQTANVPIEPAPEAWSSIDELIGRSPILPAIQRFIDESQTTDSFNLTQQNDHRFEPLQGYQPLRDVSPTGVSPMDSPNGHTTLPSSTDGTSARTEAQEPATGPQSDAHANHPSKPQDEAEKLDELAREIYQLLRQRFEIERERHGNYYPDRF